jgi:hypothetical protein
MRDRAAREWEDERRMNCDVKSQDLGVTYSRAADVIPLGRQFTSPAGCRHPRPNLATSHPRAPHERIADLIRGGSAVAMRILPQGQVPDCTPIRPFSMLSLQRFDAMSCMLFITTRT